MKGIRQWTYAFCAASVLCSCVRLELRTSDDASDRAKVAFHLDWGNVSEVERPESAYIALNSLTDGIHYLFETDADGGYLPESAHDSSALYGNYVMLAYSCDSENYILSGPERFLDDKSLSVRDFRATVKELPAEELSALKDGSTLDFNAAYRFIRTPEPLWCASLKGEVSDTRENVYDFSMMPMQIGLTLSVVVEAESGITISSVVAELSGIPATFSLLTGEADETDLARVIFRMGASAGGYEGSFAVPGLFPSENVSLSTGPGILRLSVTAEKDGVKKVLHPAINIGNRITSAALMEHVPGSDGYRIAKRSARIEIDRPLRVGAGSFSGADGGYGVEKWFDSDVVDVEI